MFGGILYWIFRLEFLNKLYYKKSTMSIIFAQEDSIIPIVYFASLDKIVHIEEPVLWSKATFYEA